MQSKATGYSENGFRNYQQETGTLSNTAAQITVPVISTEMKGKVEHIVRLLDLEKRKKKKKSMKMPKMS